jgi:hypothetical protein
VRGLCRLELRPRIGRTGVDVDGSGRREARQTEGTGQYAEKRSHRFFSLIPYQEGTIA